MKLMIASESSLHHTNGVNGSVQQIARRLVEANNDVHIITPRPGPSSLQHEGASVMLTPAVPIQGFNVGIPSNASIRKEFREHTPDILHLASPISKLSKAALNAAEQFSIPTVAIYQTDVAEYARKFASDAIAATKLKWLQSVQFDQITSDTFEDIVARRVASLHNRADLTLAPSSAAEKRLIHFGVNPDSIKRWGRGVDTHLFNPNQKDTIDAQQLHNEWSADGTRTVIGYVGRLAPEKSIHRLQALLDIEDIQIVIVGEGPSRDELQSLLGPRAIFTGKKTGEELAQSYAAFDMFVHTGSEETFGQTLQEAMASGLPVLAPNKGGPIDIIQHGTTGFLYEPTSSEELRFYVKQLLSDKAMISRFGEAGYNKVKHTTWDLLFKQLTGHYEETIENKNHNHRKKKHNK